MRGEAVGVYSQAIWTPAQLPNLVAWYKADAGVTLNGGYVSGWADQSGNGRHMTQATASRQPLYEAAGFNGKQSIKFDGVDDYLSTAHLSAVDGASGLVVGCVVQVYARSSSATTSGIVCQRNSIDGFVVDSWDANRGWRLAHPGGGSWSYQGTMTDASLDGAAIVARFFSSKNYVRKDGATSASGLPTPGSTVLTNSVACYLGVRENAGGGYGTVRLREVVIVANDLSGVDHLGTLETYLRTRRDP